MPLSIRKVYSADADEWDRIWENCSYATFYHSRQWSRVWSVYLKGAVIPDPRIIEFSDGKKVLLPLSLHRAAKGLIGRCLMSPARTYGGPIGLDSISEEHVKLICRYLAEHCPNLIMRTNPFDPFCRIDAFHPNVADETQVLDLRRGLDRVIADGSGSHRRAVAKARKAGIEIREAESEDEWRKYYDIYIGSLQRWGDEATSSYGWSFFKTVFDLKSPHVRLWTARRHDRIVAGAMIFYAKQHAVYGNGAADAEFFPVRPVNLLFQTAIEEAVKNNLAWFDFNASGGHEGVIRFKKGFGGQTIACPITDRQTGAVRFLEKFYKAWLMRASKFKTARRRKVH